MALIVLLADAVNGIIDAADYPIGADNVGASNANDRRLILIPESGMLAILTITLSAFTRSRAWTARYR